MNKELFVSSTPHETKVGLVEDDLLAEVYLERENEYTLAGSVYKGRVTRVLPGMQSAFVDIGLERDAFLYVSDFMELEEHDDDLTDVVPVPANRGVQDLRPQPARAESQSADAEGGEVQMTAMADEGTFEADALSAGPAPVSADEAGEPANGGESSGRERGSWRGRRRRRGGRRDGRDRGSDRGSDRGQDRAADRSSEFRSARPVESSTSRTPSGPPAGYQPILLPGESISKYQRYAQPPVQETQSRPPADYSAPLTESEAPLAAAFPEDEPIFAAGSLSEPLHEEHDHAPAPEEHVESASTSAAWSQEFRRPENEESPSSAWATEPRSVIEEEHVEEERIEEEEHAEDHREPQDQAPASRYAEPSHESETPVFAAPGTLEEETIDEEEEAGTIHYQSSSDEGYEEFEEETRAAGELNGDAREAVADIHLASMIESGAPPVEGAAAESEEDSEEIELEEAQAQAEAMLDAEARGTGTVDARAEVRAPAATAGYTQRSQRQRSGYERP
ncbi:MAG TPA: hypothetical protein VE866_06795, partial [Candidatus Binatia bacterium]|nr:hypothetical protein [Candidatus Binatia bacterium]